MIIIKDIDNEKENDKPGWLCNNNGGAENNWTGTERLYLEQIIQMNNKNKMYKQIG